MQDANKTTLTVNHSDLVQWNEDLCQVLVQEYARFEPFLQRAVSSVASQVVARYAADREFFVSLQGLPMQYSIRDMRSGHVGSL